MKKMIYIFKLLFLFIFLTNAFAEEAIFHKNLKIKKKDTTVNVNGGFKIIREDFYKNFKKENGINYNFLEVTQTFLLLLSYFCMFFLSLHLH